MGLSSPRNDDVPLGTAVTPAGDGRSSNSLHSIVRRWESDDSVALESVVSSAPAELQAAILDQILPREIERRRRRGEAPALEDYLSRFAGFESIVLPHFSTDHDSKSVAQTVTVSSSPAVAGAPHRDASRKAPVSDAPSSGIARYQLQELLGSGGFAQVWRAHDKLLDRAVAVKLLRPDRGAARTACESLLSEARRQGRLNVAGVVPVYDVIEAEGVFYIVSKLIEGETLAARMKRAPYTPRAAAALVAEIASTLHQAHLQNVVHRDVKPGNILIDREGKAWIADFGVAVTEDEALQEPADIVGTYAYMSPEQANGKSNEVDARADIYSLGVVLYELLTGRRPFRAREPERLLLEVKERLPRPPRTIDDQIPRELEQICLRCLSKQVGDRFSTCDDLVDALRHWLTTSELPPARSYESKAPVLHTGLWILALVALIAASGAGVWFALGGAGSDEDAREFAMSDNVAARTDVRPSPEATLQDGSPEDGHWTSLLARRPELFCWRRGNILEEPKYEAASELYSVKGQYTRWFASAGKCDGRPMHMRTQFGIRDWVGVAGLLWGLREGPPSHYRCYALEFYRTSAMQPCKLAVLEYEFQRVAFDDVHMGASRAIAVLDAFPPSKGEEAVELWVESEHLKIRFQEQDWEPSNQAGKYDWLPKGPFEVGLTGGGDEVSFRRFSIRTLDEEKHE